MILARLIWVEKKSDPGGICIDLVGAVAFYSYIVYPYLFKWELQQLPSLETVGYQARWRTEVPIQHIVKVGTIPS